jgi:arylsulfatase A-like enzyme
VEVKKQYLGQITIPQALKRANPEYQTAHFGKWHNESIKPSEAGYDVTDGPNGNGPGDLTMTVRRISPTMTQSESFRLRIRASTS